MRVLHLDSEKAWRGGEQQVAYLIGELTGLGVANYVGCQRGSRLQAYCRSHGIAHQPLDFGGLHLRAARQVRAYGQAISPNLIHLHAAKAHSAGVYAHRMGLRVPLVLSKRTVFPLRRNPLSRFKYKYQGVARILCVSRKIKSMLDEELGKPNRNIVVYSGIDPARFKSDRNQNLLKIKYGLPEKSLLVGTTGALTPDKDHYTFIRACRLLCEHNADFRFLIMGKGPLQNELETFVAQKKLAGHFIFTGFVDNLEDVLPGLDFFLMTSRQEGLGTSILDAMACRLPVVATAAGGIPEIVIHGKTGCLAPIGDHNKLAGEILGLIDNPGRRAQLVEAAYHRLDRHFTKRKMAHKTYTTYNEILSA